MFAIDIPRQQKIELLYLKLCMQYYTINSYPTNSTLELN